MPLKKYSIAFLVLAVFTVGVNYCLADFSDVQPVNRYYGAIEYLSAAGLVKGYPDGTFKPDSSINRAEFLKLVMDGSNILPDVTTVTGFSDVDESAWYAKYIRKALKEGWVDGYPDHTFRPADMISKAEALKIIGKIQSWELPAKITDPPYIDTPADAWFTPYIAYAKSRNFLEEIGSYYIPDAMLSRGKTCEILFRTYLTSLNNRQSFTQSMALNLPKNTIGTGSTLLKPVIQPPPSLNFTPVAYASSPSGFFDNITLDGAIPNTFYLNEVYFFKGTIVNGNFDKAFIFLAPENDDNTSDFIDYVGTVSGNKLSVPVYFKKAGNYRLGLITGSSGESKVIDISVLPSLPPGSSNRNSEAPSGLDIKYQNQESTISWNSSLDHAFRLEIFQGNKTESFISRQNISSFDLPYEYFDGFKEGPADFLVEEADMSSLKPLQIADQWTSSVTKEFNAVSHHFIQYQKEDVNIGNLPETYAGGKAIQFSGTAKNEIFRESAVTKPDGLVDLINLSSTKPYGTYFDSATIGSGNDFVFSYKTVQPGTYFVEINGRNGEAVLNYPVYPDTYIPLLPDFFDLHQFDQKENTFNLTQFREQLLNLINADRVSAGLPTLRLDASLDNLAQLYSNDMVARNFFGHIDPDNKTPDDRRIAQNIPTIVGENLAEAPTILYTHYGLMRSGVHRNNTLDPKWTRVGIGIALGTDGQLYTTEEFSSDPLTEIDLLKIKGEILDQINGQRQTQREPLITIDATLAAVADNWSSKMASQNFFDFISPDGETLNNIVQKQNTGHSVQAVILESSDRDKLIQEIINGDDSTKSDWQALGIGLKVDNIGSLKATLLYTTY